VRPPRRLCGQSGVGSVAAVVLAVTLFTFGSIVGRSMAPSDHSDHITARWPEARARAQLPALQSRRSRAGAVAVATAFLDALRWTVLVDDRRRMAVVRRFAAAGAGTTVDAGVSQGIADVRQAVAATPVVVRPAFLGYRVGRFTARRASVSIWGMALFGSGAYEPVSQWATSSLDLAWQRGTWKVASIQNRPGPSPQWSISELARPVVSFEEYRHVP
jgi:hypothetical protein